VFDAAEIQASLGLLEGYDTGFRQLETQLTMLADVPITDPQATAFFRDLVSPERDKANDREVRGVNLLTAAYNNAPGAAPGTAYGLLQAVTFWADHKRGKNDDRRMDGAMFGTGAAIKQLTLENALQLVAA